MLYVLKQLLEEILSVFRIDRLLHLYQEQGLEGLYTFEGITGLLVCAMPLLLVYELLRSVFTLRKGISAFTLSLFIEVINRLLSRVLSFSVAAYCILLLSPYALFKTHLSWYWFIYSYIVWELGHFIYHYLAHRVRLFWCLHSTHHAPEEMNLSVSYSHFFLEAAFTDLIRVSVCILLGVNPVVLAMVAVVDWFWAELNHISEDTWKNARMGYLGKLLLTPSHHRVHHSRNAIYLDKNFGNLLPIWDRIFRTYQEELPEEKPDYGITRPMNSHNFWDVYFGEIVLLVKDVYYASSLKHKLLYLIMPPGWHPGKRAPKRSRSARTHFDPQKG